MDDLTRNARCSNPAGDCPPPAAMDGRGLHLLNRLGFGPAPGDLAQIGATGPEAYLRAQLRPGTLPQSAELERRLQSLPTLRLDPIELFAEYGPMRRRRRPKPDPQALQAMRARRRQVQQQAVAARLLRAIYSTRQLQEVMVDFWFNHFNVFAGKGLDHLWAGAYEEEAIRPHVFGRFRELLEATARHPAMLFYLDNWQNTAPGSPGARGRFQGINENYARELMELHTLGVDAGYTQADVIALAHILTGWGLARPGLGHPDRSGFYFDPDRHDFGDKRFLGHAIRGRGEAEVEQALAILAAHPSTARHLSVELVRYFVADQPPQALADRLADCFLNTGGDLRAMSTVLFESREFQDPQYFGNKFKTPLQYVVSAIRAAGAPVDDVRPLAGFLFQLGMPVYGCQTPDGYKNTRDAWLNADAMQKRLDFAVALGSGRLPLAGTGVARGPNRLAMRAAPGVAPAGRAVTPLDSDRLAATLGDAFSDKTRRVIAGSPPPLRAALMLGSPEFMYR